eukprot:TRINITY_DN3556_c0_g3_i1.p1 TRINITY_DN3556_c0_g3~~TRINITY_DN3556_c0_g3_i1.p1  ORF type:complete len:105 (+),score=7.14 TRINITY_DN3556_c0_g3_i1:376-690(+)
MHPVGVIEIGHALKIKQPHVYPSCCCWVEVVGKLVELAGSTESNGWNYNENEGNSWTTYFIFLHPHLKESWQNPTQPVNLAQPDPHSTCIKYGSVMGQAFLTYI